MISPKHTRFVGLFTKYWCADCEQIFHHEQTKLNFSRKFRYHYDSCHIVDEIPRIKVLPKKMGLRPMATLTDEQQPLALQ